MKKIFIKALAGVMLAFSATSCGDSFLETDMSDAIDMDGALDNPANIEVALNGTYYRLCDYYFAGNFAISQGDLLSDIMYWNGSNSHQNAIYECSYLDTYYGFEYVWSYGYKVIDNSARIIEACDKLLATAEGNDVKTLNRCKAEALALRAYSMLILTNSFGHQVKVQGQDFSTQPGVVIVDKPIEAGTQVSRSTIGDCYNQIINDLTESINAFNAGGARSSIFFMTPAAAYGIMARALLYLEDWTGAYEAAAKALNVSGKKNITYDVDEYVKLYAGGNSNTESIFALAIDAKTNWSANSMGTLYTTYCYGPSPYLISLYGEDDIRAAAFYWTNDEGTALVEYGAAVPWFGGGKFGWNSTGNPAYSTNYLVNAPEMYLIMSEAYLKLGQMRDAQLALLAVAKRDNAITSIEDLPSTVDGMMSFIRDERARELFQEGHRFWDLRRWNVTTNVNAYDAPNINYVIKNVKLGDVVFPVPDSEINTGFGVTQNDSWNSTRPQ